MSRFFKSAAFPILIVVVLAFFAQKLISGPPDERPTTFKDFQEQLAAGVPVLLEIDLNGARQVRAAMPDARLVFLAPPSFDELAVRLGGRGTEDPERIRERLDIARIELAAEDEFDHIVVNDDIGSAADRLVALMEIAS